MAQSSSEAEWLRVRRNYLNEHPPNHQGYYTCYICHKWIPANEITIDHIIPRSRAPHLRYDYANLAPACWSCNIQKGSKVLDAVERTDNTDLDDIW